MRVEDLFEIPLKGWNRKGKRVKKNIKEREREKASYVGTPLRTIITDIVFKMGLNTLVAQTVSF